MKEVKRLTWDACDEHACRCDIVESSDGDMVNYEDYAALKADRDALAQQVVNLAAENSTIKTMNDCLSEELRGYESDGAFNGPDMHKLWYSHAGALPETSIMLAEIQAQGVDMAIKALVTSDDDGFVDAPNILAMLAYQFRKGAAV